ncbi:MAG TPA: ATP-binding protein [Mycobacteriales bacterium]|nr:ATP-binding protein [Mycobacteriales bacterium]
MLTLIPATSLRGVRINVVARIAHRLGPDAPAWLREEHNAGALGVADDLDRPVDPVASLPADDARILVACGLIESDIRYGALFAELQQPLAARRPCVGLLSWLLEDDPVTRARCQERCHALVERGLLAVDNPADPRSEWSLRILIVVWDLLVNGRVTAASLPAGLTLRVAESFPDLADVIVAPGIVEAALRLPQILRSGEVTAVVLRGMEASGRLTLLGAAARELGRDLVVHDGLPSRETWHLLGALAEVGGVLPVITADPGPGERLELPPLPGLESPVGIVLGRSGNVSGEVTQRAVTIELEPVGEPERVRAWAAAGRPLADGCRAEITRSFLLTPGSIRRVADLAVAAAHADQRDAITTEDVRVACGFVRRQTLEAQATRLSPLADLDPPALSLTAAAELATLVARCRHREQLVEQGPDRFGGTLNRGVRALFSGPSGTGKTLTARYLAAQLHLDVYRIDLAAVVNKYIGETERNLDRVFSRAEELDVLVLLDEGDALMARRTDVSNANDRYANLETNFLLQRLETFCGIVVITTNAGSRIDPAFLRRIDVTVDFTPPDAELRWQLWRSHLAAGHDVNPVVLEDIARRCAFTGAQIRNAALHALMLAMDEERPIRDVDVVTAVQREYRRAGASSPLAR